VLAVARLLDGDAMQVSVSVHALHWCCLIGLLAYRVAARPVQSGGHWSVGVGCTTLDDVTYCLCLIAQRLLWRLLELVDHCATLRINELSRMAVVLLEQGLQSAKSSLSIVVQPSLVSSCFSNQPTQTSSPLLTTCIPTVSAMKRWCWSLAALQSAPRIRASLEAHNTSSRTKQSLRELESIACLPLL
jgi:hypothetical protein